MNEKQKPPFREAKVEPEPAPPPVSPEYADMVSAPLDGTHILLSDGTTKVRALWVRTRRMDKGRWTPYGYWVNAWDRAKLAFDPTGWRPAPADWEVLRADTEQARRDDLARRT